MRDRFLTSCCAAPETPSSRLDRTCRRDDSLASFASGAGLEFGPVYSGEWVGRWTSRFAVARLFYVLETGPDVGFVADSASQVALVPGAWAILPPWREIRHCQLPGLRVVSVHFRLVMRSRPDPLAGCSLCGGIAPEWRASFLPFAENGGTGVGADVPGVFAAVQSAVWAALALFIQKEGPSVSRRISRGKPFARLFDAVEENPARDFSVAEMAAEVRMGESSFAKRFTATTGETPRAWFNATRARAAAEALLDEGATVRAVSERFGFCSEFYFSRFFKRHFGVSPARWRRQRLV